ncbi:MAG: hypothetical protein IPP42_17025 [Saprospiraceae bacterium]|nr:hypothetical protein [Saprospiraceae bacterium]
MERQLNFGRLAIHRTAVVSKLIMQNYYCAAPAKSYFAGCSAVADKQWLGSSILSRRF